jgi:hypothetical protein
LDDPSSDEELENLQNTVEQRQCDILMFKLLLVPMTPGNLSLKFVSGPEEKRHPSLREMFKEYVRSLQGPEEGKYK